MSWQVCCNIALAVLMLISTGLNAQPAPTAPTPQAKGETPPPAASAIAATVNGQTVTELAVYRAMIPEERKVYDRARKEILEHLIENTLIDQYLLHLKIPVDPKEIEEKMGIIKTQAEKSGGLDKVLKAHFVTEAELRHELTGQLRWDRFVIQQSTNEKLLDFFSKNMDVFNGSQVHARHILIKGDQGLSTDQATAQLLKLKKSIEEETRRELGKLPANERSDKRATEMLEKSFADAASRHSACPSKENGGDLRWFQRAGMMVEPFARTAFALRPYQMSDVVVTQFGYHLILTVDRKPGKDVKFDDVKALVQEVYSDRLREAVVQAMRPNAKIAINPPAK